MAASVACDCFDEGLGARCPLEAEHDLAGRLYPPDGASDEELERFDAWLDSGCAHEGHRFVWEEISNWSDLGVIVRLLEDHAEAFPALCEAVGGTTDTFDLTMPDLSVKALEELDAFDALCERDPLVPRWMPSVSRRFRTVFEASVELNRAVVWD